MDFYFNERSIREAPDKETALQWMDTLMDVCQDVARLGFGGLKTTDDFINSSLAPAYRLSDFLSDPSIKRETRTFLLTKVTRPPFAAQILKEKEGDQNRLYQFKCNVDGRMVDVTGLGLAYLFDSLALSFANDSAWDTASICIRVDEYSEDDTVRQSDETVRHGSQKTHLIGLGEWLALKKKRSVPNGKLLWLKRNQLFPHLVFCAGVQSQILNFRAGEPEFQAILKRLFELESYCVTWETGGFNADGLPSKVTPESETRRATLRERLSIQCPDGKTREFSLHSRYTPGAGRIHFSPDAGQRIIYIGYIGQKIQ